MKKQWKKTALVAVIAVLAAFCFCACGAATVTTEEAGEYLEEGTQSEGSGGEAGTCTIMIECGTILNNMEKMDEAKKVLVPEDGVILATTTVEYEAGESVMDVLQRICMDNKIHMEFIETPAYDGGYVEGINNIYEFDCGAASGWDYFVNDWAPNYGAGNYIVSDGDVIQWRYSCDNGKDLQIEFE